MKYAKVKEKGQALLIILLVLSVGLTVVLSVASRSVTDINISTQEEDSLRAFSAAEAGIEESLLSGGSVPLTSLSNDAQFETDYVVPSAGSRFYYPQNLYSGERAPFWLVSHDANGVLTCNGEPCLQANSAQFCWGDPDAAVDNTSPAIEVSIFYDDTQNTTTSDDYSNVSIRRVAYDGVSARQASNNFSPASSGCNIDGKDYLFSTGTIDFSTIGISCGDTAGCLLLASVRMFYNETTAHPIGITTAPLSGSSLPSQGVRIESTGTSGDATRKVTVYRTFSTAPGIFDAGVFSYTNLLKSNN